MADFQAVFYRAADGTEPVSAFIDGLSVKRQVVLDNQIDRLNMLSPSNPHLPFPHSSQIEGELREFTMPLWAGALPCPVPAITEPDRPAPHLPEGHGQGSRGRD